MRTLALVSSCALLVAFAACDDDAASPPTTADGGTADASSTADAASTSDAGGEGGATYVEPTNCDLRNDTGGPGQYSDGCVKRSWVESYAGRYTSGTCELTIDITGAVAATFRVKVNTGPLVGDYTTSWDGAPSPGNDSYYRFTTDATFTTTKTLNFTSGQKVDTSDERAISLRVENLDTGTPVFKGRYSEVISGSNQEHDCGVMTKQ